MTEKFQKAPTSFILLLSLYLSAVIFKGRCSGWWQSDAMQQSAFCEWNRRTLSSAVYSPPNVFRFSFATNAISEGPSAKAEEEIKMSIILFKSAIFFFSSGSICLSSILELISSHWLNDVTNSYDCRQWVRLWRYIMNGVSYEIASIFRAIIVSLARGLSLVYPSCHFWLPLNWRIELLQCNLKLLRFSSLSCLAVVTKGVIWWLICPELKGNW